jgi:hypothetical protein
LVELWLWEKDLVGVDCEKVESYLAETCANNML